MPVIEMKTNTIIDQAQQAQLCKGFQKAFQIAGEEEISHNLLIQIEGEKYINFRGNDTEPAALIIIHPGYMTPEKDYPALIRSFFDCLKEIPGISRISQKRIYITISSIDHWGFDGNYLGKPSSDNV